ncbi:MAG: EamA family transporter [Oligosphaeraceae bacterium]|nr:EamA family transporter [Oligosphaeraceae bacterium]
MPYLLLVSFIWSFSFVIIKGELTDLDANLVAFLRLFLALLVFLPFLRPKRFDFALGWRLFALGAVQFGLMYSAYIASFSYLPAHMLVLLTTTTPLYVVFFDMLLTRRNAPFFWAAALVAVLACCLLQYGGEPLQFNWKGFFLVQLSNLAFAAGQIYYRYLSQNQACWEPLSHFAIVYLGAAVFTLLSTFCSGGWQQFGAISARQWLLLAYLGLIASGLCFFLWNLGGSKVSAGSYALLNNLKIPLGVLVSIRFLGERCNYVVLAVTFVVFMCSVLLCEKAATQLLPVKGLQNG